MNGDALNRRKTCMNRKNIKKTFAILLTIFQLISIASPVIAENNIIVAINKTGTGELTIQSENGQQYYIVLTYFFFIAAVVQQHTEHYIMRGE